MSFVLLLVASCAGDAERSGDETDPDDPGAVPDELTESLDDDPSGPEDPAGMEEPGSVLPAEAGVERAGGLRRFDLAGVMCTVPLLESRAACPADDDKCLCVPEFEALNRPRGSAGNPSGRVVVISQPRFGRRADGTYAFDAYAAIKAAGNVVGHYVNALNPSLSCTAAESWTDRGCAGGGGCGWRCITGAARADQLIEQEIATYAGLPAPEAILLNEAWSTIYADTQAGVTYRRWLRDLTRRLAARDRLPILFVQERHAPAGPYTLLSEIAEHALIGVEAYLSGREVMNAPGRCAPPYDASNWCVREYLEVRSAIRESASPAIPNGRLVMTEHFASNTRRFETPTGAVLNAGWGRAYDDDPASPTFGSPTTTLWNTIIERRARALAALPSLGGVASYAWAGNGSGTGSAFRLEFMRTWSAVALP